jgi:hypothetical protein
MMPTVIFGSIFTIKAKVQSQESDSMFEYLALYYMKKPVF